MLIDQSNTRGAVIFSGRVFSSKDLGGGFNDSSKHPFECLHRNSMMRFSGSATLSNLEEPGPEFHFKLTAMQVLQ